MAVRSFNSRSSGGSSFTSSARPATPTPPPVRGRRWLKPRDRILLVVVAVLTIAVVVAALVRRGDDDNHSTTPGSGVTSGAGAALPGQLKWGTAVAGPAAGTGRVYGVPVGFPHTADGGVAAAVNYAQAGLAQGTWNTAHAPAIYEAVFAPSYLADTATWDAVKEVQEQMRIKYSLNDAGQVTSGGVVDPAQVFVSRCDPRFGAYRPVSVSADKAVVDVWGPCVFGVPLALPSLQGTSLTWGTTRTTVEWTGGSWKVTASDDGPADAPRKPSGAQAIIPPSFATRAATVPGTGWLVAKNAVETFDPTTEWTTPS